MLFIEPSNGNHSAKRSLHVTIHCYDQSKIHAEVDELILHFETTLGDVKISLAAIRRLERLGHAISAREIMDANKFRITCLDGSVIVGIPRSPSTLHVRTVGSLQAHGKIKMVDIDLMTVAAEMQPTTAKPLATFAGQAAAT